MNRRGASASRLRISSNERPVGFQPDAGDESPKSDPRRASRNGSEQGIWRNGGSPWTAERPQVAVREDPVQPSLLGVSRRGGERSAVSAKDGRRTPSRTSVAAELERVTAHGMDSTLAFRSRTAAWRM